MTKTTLNRQGKVVTTTLPPTIQELDAEIRANAKLQRNQTPQKEVVCLTPNERAERRKSILDLAKKAGLQTQALDFSEDDFNELSRKSVSILEKLKAVEKKSNTEPTWYLPNQGYYLAKVSTTIYGIKVAGLYIKSDRIASPTIERLSIKGTAKEITFAPGMGIPYMDYQTLSPAEFEALLKNKPSWDVLRKTYGWDQSFWPVVRFDMQHPTIIY